MCCIFMNFNLSLLRRIDAIDLDILVLDDFLSFEIIKILEVLCFVCNILQIIYYLQMHRALVCY